MTEPLTPQQLAEQFRVALLKGERASAVRLVRSYGAIWQRLQDSITALDAEIAAKAELGQTWKAAKSANLKALQKQVEAELNRYAAVVEDEMDAGTRQAIEMAQTHARELTQASLPGVAVLDAKIMQSWNMLNPDAVASMLGFLAQDSPLRVGLRTKFGAEVAQGVADALTEGMALGYGPRKVAGIVRKQSGMALDSALRLSRTTQLNAYRESTRAAYVANNEIVPKWRWTCAKQANTCMSCIAMDGTLHKYDEPLNDHWNGKCCQVPVPIDYADLGLDVPRTPRPQWESGSDWFNKQPESIQRQMMGKGKYDAWKSGKIKLNDLTQETDDKIWGKMRTETPLKDIPQIREYKHFDDKSGAYVWADDSYGKLNNKINQRERQAIFTYTGSNKYVEWNKALRQNEPISAEIEGLTKNLDMALSKARLSEDVVVWRAGEIYNNIGSLDRVVGTVIQDKGYVSTALTESTAKGFMALGKRTMMQIRLPKGMKAASVNPEEYEVLLPRGTSFRVIDTYTHTTEGYRVLVMEPIL